MRILFLTQLFPYPPVCGGTIRSYNILRHLGIAHDVTLVSFIRTPPSEDQMAAVRLLCRTVHTVPIHRSTAANLISAAKSIIGSTPFIISRDDIGMMRRTVDKILRQGRFDLVYADHLQMAQYVTGWHGAPKVLDEHNVEWKIVERFAGTEPFGPRKLFAELEWQKLRAWELQACKTFDKVFTVTETDRETLDRESSGQIHALCIPIGVNTATFSQVQLNANAKTIVSIGTMSWPPNIDSVHYFAKSVYPIIKRRAPGVRFVVAGKNPPPSIRRLAEADDSIQVTGFVQDPAQLMGQAAAFVVPLRSGSGMRVKILNAMAMGVPVVTTSLGCEGIGGVSGRDYLVADHDESFAEAVLRLLDDWQLRRTIAENARKFVTENYAWESIYDRLDAAISDVLSGTPAFRGVEVGR